MMFCQLGSIIKYKQITNDVYFHLFLLRSTDCFWSSIFYPIKSVSKLEQFFLYFGFTPQGFAVNIMYLLCFVQVFVCSFVFETESIQKV